MKKIFSLFLVALLVILTGIPNEVIAAEKNTIPKVFKNYAFVVLNDELIEFKDAEPEIKDGKTYVPIRIVAEKMGAKVKYSSKTDKVTITKDDKKVVIDQKNKTLTTDNEESFEIEMFKKEKRTMIPCKYIAEHFGYEVSSIKEGLILRIKNEEAKLEDKEIYSEIKSDITKKQKELEKKLKPKKVIYITFDDGPNKYTNDILDVLDEHNMKATFFMLSGNMKSYKSVVKRTKKEGHGLALHGVTHDYNKFYKNTTSPLYEMNTANKTLKSIVGSSTKLIRTPYGSSPYLSNSQYKKLADEGYKLWDWNIDSNDWSYKNADKTYKHVISSIKKSKSSKIVVLLHNRKETAETLEKVLDWMEDNNYTSKAITSKISPLNWH